MESGTASEPPGEVESGAKAAPPVADEPPPISQAVAHSQAVPEPIPDQMRMFRSSGRRSGREGVLAVRARVEAVKAQEKKLPQLLSWGEDGQVATQVQLAVLEPVCGAGAGEKVTAWYPGGVLADGSGFRTSEMPEDLAVGGEYVLWLERLDGDWYLTSSSFLLAPASSHTFKSRGGAPLSTAQLKGVCP